MKSLMKFSCFIPFVLILVSMTSGLSAPILGAQEDHSASHSHASHTGSGQTEVQMYTCSMHPQVQLRNPGKCPICGMDLIPVKKDLAEGAGRVRGLRELQLSPYARKLAQIVIAPVERKFVQAEVRMVGFVVYDETRLATITAWIPGRIDRLYVDFTGAVVRKGDRMVNLYSPQLLSAQQELLQSIKAARDLTNNKLSTITATAQATVLASKEKLRLWGLTPQQIDEIVQRGKPSDHMTIMAPVSGVVIQRNGLEGMYVQTGTQLYTVADLSQVWIQLDAYESDLMWIREGQEVQFEAETYPGRIFRGQVAFIDPFLRDKTRTARVRLNAPNPDSRLKPNMFVHATLRATLAEDGQIVVKPAGNEKPPLVIPASAPLITGKRAVVYVAIPDKPGTFVGREIVLGPRASDSYLVATGLEEGEQVVTRGNFMIDSSLQIQAQPSMMNPEAGGGDMIHHHGVTTPGVEAAPQGGGMNIPSSFKQQLTPILTAYDNLSMRMSSKQLGTIRSAFSNVRQAVKEVEADQLADHPQMVWNELQMLLGNEALVGSEALSLKEAERVFAEMTHDLGKLRRQFGLDQDLAVQEASPPGKAEAPGAFKDQIGAILNAYATLQQALTGDHLDQAQKAGRSLESAVGSVDMGHLEGATRDLLMNSLSDLKAALAKMNEATDMGTFRQCFALLSETLAKVVETFGFRPGAPVYKIRCPMAFEGRGATWLQRDQEVRNPYFGAAMPGCGEVVETYFGSGQKSPEVMPHE